MRSSDCDGDDASSLLETGSVRHSDVRLCVASRRVLCTISDAASSPLILTFAHKKTRQTKAKTS